MSPSYLVQGGEDRMDQEELVGPRKSDHRLSEKALNAESNPDANNSPSLLCLETIHLKLDVCDTIDRCIEDEDKIIKKLNFQLKD